MGRKISFLTQFYFFSKKWFLIIFDPLNYGWIEAGFENIVFVIVAVFAFMTFYNFWKKIPTINFFLDLSQIWDKINDKIIIFLI